MVLSFFHLGQFGSANEVPFILPIPVVRKNWHTYRVLFGETQKLSCHNGTMPSTPTRQKGSSKTINSVKKAQIGVGTGLARKRVNSNFRKLKT